MPEPSPLHEAAAVGFERAAEAYERGRPSFPDEAVRAITAWLGLSAGRRILELGPGTGKLTRSLIGSGSRIVGLEPVDAMRRVLVGAVPEATAIGGVAEALPFRDATFDGATAAQVFHWLDGDRAIPELARVLVAGAPVALVWNVRDEAHTWVRALTDVIEPFRGATPTHRDGTWRTSFARSDAFAPLERTSFAYEHGTTRDGVVDRIDSISFVAALGDDDRAAIAERVRTILAGIGATGPSDEVAFPYRTEVWRTARR